MKIEKINYLTLLIVFLLTTLSMNAQSIRRDDFKFKSNYWYWRADGNQSVPTVDNGLLHLKLENAVDTGYCNTEIYDPNEPYSPGTHLRIRLKGSPQHIGSRGWGFWDGSLSSVMTDYDVAWVMQQKGVLTDPEYNWFLFGVDGDSVIDRSTIELSNLINETNWNTYHIVWRSDSTFLYINDSEIFVATNSLPDENMRVDLWIDNRVINIDAPLLFQNYNSTGSELFVDYIELYGENGPSIQRENLESIVLWDSPNTYPNGDNETIWKNYNFETLSSGESLVFITGDAESYGSTENDDDLRIELNGNDYGWDTSESLNGDSENGMGSSVPIVVNLNNGLQNLKLFSDNTPFLRDVIVLSNENGKVIINNSYDETAQQNDSLWKSINFTSTKESNTFFLISGTGYSNDKIRIEIDGEDFTYSGINAIDGNELLGTPKTVVISRDLLAGSHNIKIYKTGSPTLYNIAAYSVPLNKIEIKVLLEGCYQGAGNMSSIIANSNDFPKLQPFNKPPWDYNGTEKISTVPENIIDWVLVELRNNLTNPTKKYYQAGLLRSDGIISNSDGQSLRFLGLDTGSYYLTVYHQNHISIISSNSILIQ